MSTALPADSARVPADVAPPMPDVPAVLREALALAELGLRVIPLHPRDKIPRIRQWQKRATTDPAKIHEWFAERPDDNLGLATGDGLIALDLDEGGKQSFDDLMAQGGEFPETARAQTGSGGEHILLRMESSGLTITNFRPKIDVRGDGGQIVVAPSLHPKTGKAYQWIRHPRDGIAEAPEWLVRQLREWKSNGRSRRASERVKPTRTRGEPDPIAVSSPGTQSPPAGKRQASRAGTRVKIDLSRQGDPEEMLTELIARFPVSGHGERHKAMTQAVGSLLGRGYDREFVERVLHGWHERFWAQGVTRTALDEAAREVAACIESTIRNSERGGFVQARGGQNHADECRQIALDERQHRLLDQGVVVMDGAGQKRLRLPEELPSEELPSEEVKAEKGKSENAPSQRTPHCKRVTQIGIRLCKSADERVFVEALLRWTIYKFRCLEDETAGGVMKLTNDQVRDIAVARGLAKSWGPEQFERLKRKFVTRERDGKPASRFELLREIHKGHHKPNETQGVPSAYETTGIRELVALPERAEESACASDADLLAGN